MSESSSGPTEEELVNARRSGRLAADNGFPPGVCRYPAGTPLAQVWMQAYTDALPDEPGDAL
ncbi:hypothetical protein ABT352_32735 [Streptosporangium sp. NPDC000563]|uniref:hypothetical protein n=1 Tax=Streptosporangium sp. NPDC000563 TaxID=3154366 RepID=UPI00332AC536